MTSTWWRLDQLLTAFQRIHIDKSTPSFLHSYIKRTQSHKLLDHDDKLSSSSSTSLFVTAQYQSYIHDNDYNHKTHVSHDSTSPLHHVIIHTRNTTQLVYYPYHTLLILPITLSIVDAMIIQLSYSRTHKLLFIPATMRIPPPTSNWLTFDVIYYYVQYFMESKASKHLISTFIRRNPDLLAPQNDPSQSPSRYHSLFQYFARPRASSNENTTKHNDKHIISPVNGLVVSVVDARQNKQLDTIKINNHNDIFWLTVKGESFGVHPFLRSCPHICNLYLRPSDYHHFHSPVTGYITNIYGYKGGREYLFNVQTRATLASYWQAIHVNTKLILEILYGNGLSQRVYMIIIGGKYINSFHMNETILLSLYNASQRGTTNGSSSIHPCHVTAGQHLGYFTFGSSVVLCASQSWSQAVYHTPFCQPIKVGQALT